MTLSRRVLMSGGGGSFTSPPDPWPAEWLAMAHNNDYSGGGSFDNYIHAFTSPDGLAWTKIGTGDIAGSVYSAGALRDPSLMRYGDAWWVCTTATSGSSDSFKVLSCADYGDELTLIATVSTAGVSSTATWAPQWFVDTDDSVHVVVSIQTSGTRKLYEVHPTNEAMTTWSTPVLIGGTGWPTNTIDPNLTYWEGTYYLLHKDDGSGDIDLAESSSPFSGYTMTHGSDWHGWKSSVGAGSIEGPKVVDIGTGWRAYFSHNSGYNSLDIYYSETTDRTMSTGWSEPSVLSDFDTYNHALPIIRPA